MLRQIAQSAVCAQSGLFGHAAAALVAGSDLLPAACRKRVSMPGVGQHRHMSAATPDDVTSFVKEVWQAAAQALRCDVLRVLCEPSAAAAACVPLVDPVCCLVCSAGDGNPGHPGEASACHLTFRQKLDSGSAGGFPCTRAGSVC